MRTTRIQNILNHYDRNKSATKKIFGDNKYIKGLKGSVGQLNSPAVDDELKPDQVHSVCALLVLMDDKTLQSLGYNLLSQLIENDLNRSITRFLIDNQGAREINIGSKDLDSIRKAYNRLPSALRNPDSIKLLCNDWVKQKRLTADASKLAETLNLLPTDLLTKANIDTLSGYDSSKLKLLRQFFLSPIGIVREQAQFDALCALDPSQLEYIAVTFGIFFNSIPSQLFTWDNFSRFCSLPHERRLLITRTYWSDQLPRKLNRSQDIFDKIYQITYSDKDINEIKEELRVYIKSLPRDVTDKELRAEQFNPHQSTHTQSVHKTVSESAIRLKKRYGHKISEPSDFKVVIDEIKKWGIELKKESKNKSLNDKYKKEKGFAAAAIEHLTQNNYNFVDKISGVSTKELFALLWLGAHDETADVRKSTLADAKHQIMMSLYDYKRNYNQDVFGRDHLYEKSTGNICEGGTFNKLMSSLWGIHCDIVIEYITLAAFSEKFPIVVMEELNDYLQNLYQEATTAEKEAQFFALLNTIKQGVTKQLWDETLNSKVSERLFSEFSVLFKDRNDIKFISELSAYEDVDVSGLKWDLFKRKFTEEEKYPNPTMPVQLPPLVGNLQLESKEWNRTNSLIEQLKIETNLKTYMQDYQDIKLLSENLRKVEARIKDNNPAVRLPRELESSLLTIWVKASELMQNAQNHTKDEVARMRKIVKDTNHITSLILSPAARPPRKECEKLLKDYRRNVETLPKNSFLWAQVWGAALMLVGIASIAMGIVCMATGLGIGGGVFCIAIGLVEYGCGHRMFKSGRGIGLRESVEDFADGAKKVLRKN